MRFTPILEYIGWNCMQAIDGWHVQPRSVACQQQLVLAKSSLYICIAMVKGESNSCQFHESWVLSFSCGSCHLSNLTPVHINSFILHHLVTLGSVFFLIIMIIISVLGSMTIPNLWATLKSSLTTPSVLTIIEYLAMYLPLLNTWQSSQMRKK